MECFKFQKYLNIPFETTFTINILNTKYSVLFIQKNVFVIDRVVYSTNE